jgi:protein-tyrosine phosphatase
MPPQRKILFVCMGNIVRSPLAENLFRQRAGQRGLDGRYQVDSAGTSSYHVGQVPDDRMRQTASRHGLDYTGRSRQVTPRDLETFDLIVALDSENYEDLRALADRMGINPEIRRLREFDREGDGALDVPDPYYGGQVGFEETFNIISRAVDGLMESLEGRGK